MTIDKCKVQIECNHASQTRFPRSRLGLECESKEALPRYASAASTEEAGASNA